MKPADSSAPCRRVLIVDRSAECREVLRTVLERRGVQILEASRPASALKLARQHQPDVVVFDLEVGDEGEQLRDELGQITLADHGALILLASTRADLSAADREHVVPKPYHYGPLIRKIEQLIERSGP